MIVNTKTDLINPPDLIISNFLLNPIDFSAGSCQSLDFLPKHNLKSEIEDFSLFKRLRNNGFEVVHKFLWSKTA